MRSDIKKAYYRQLGPENICISADCRNYCARGKAAYPKVAGILPPLGRQGGRIPR